MAHVKREIEVCLEKIEIPLIEGKVLDHSSHLVGLDLIWPRAIIACRSGEQSCRLERGFKDFSRENWGRRILVREDVEGMFAIRLSLSEDLGDEGIEKFFRFWGGMAIGMGAKAIESAVPVAGKLVAAPIEYAGNQIAKYPGPETEVEGLGEFNSSEFLKDGTRLVTLQMFSARRIKRVVRKRLGKRTRSEIKILMEKGVPNGTVTLRIRSF